MEMETENELRNLFVAICQRAFQMGLQRSTGGNLSLRLGPNRLLVKPSGFSLLDLEPHHILLCDDQGLILEGQGKPTKELISHLTIYRVRPEVRGIAHYHPPYATAFAAVRKPLPLLTVQAMRILERVPLVEPVGEGSPQLAEALGEVFKEPAVKAALLAEHGIIAVGKDLTQAQNLAELVEESAQVAYLAKGLQHASVSV
ncbi:MAG: class II aldolase/adducin family protein [Deltaproteobacteria bacterium]|nr:class II aldolase/adducin family protein [Deltaproteobacteria bacterium]